MSTLLLRLAGPMQSWGDATSRFPRRNTRNEPTKSGVLGLLAAADGRRRSDSIEDLASLRFGVRVDQPGQLVRDFQTAIRPTDSAVMPLSYRFYLSDAVFVCGVEGDRELLTGLDAAIKDPAFPLYLGRRSCPPTGHVSLGIVDVGAEPALRQTEWQAAKFYRRSLPKQVSLRLVLDKDESVPASEYDEETVRDVPLSYNPERREYGWRDVVHAAPVTIDNPAGHSEPDYFAALGGN